MHGPAVGARGNHGKGPLAAGAGRRRSWAQVVRVHVPPPVRQPGSAPARLSGVLVQNRPKLFVNNWPGGGENEVDYQEGDFIHFQLSNTSLSVAELYGGIRIVSMSPRIVEVYLALPNP